MPAMGEGGHDKFGWKADIARRGVDGQNESMRETAPAVRSQNSVLRDALPFYSIGHFAFAAVLVVGIYLVMLRLDPATAAVVSLGSLLGMAAVGSFSKPSWMLISPDQVDQLKRLLGARRYHRESTGGWVPPLPKWLRWGYNKVCIRREDGAALVTGPAIILRGLAAELNGQA